MTSSTDDEVANFTAQDILTMLDITDQITEEIIWLQTSPLSPLKIENEGLDELLEEYNIYDQQTLNGEFRKTSDFHMMYINLTHHYLTSSSIQTGDFELFRYVLLKINLFFISNQQNHALCTVKYYTYLLNVNQRHFDLLGQFQQGCSGTQRNKKQFLK